MLSDNVIAKSFQIGPIVAFFQKPYIREILIKIVKTMLSDNVIAKL